MTDRFLYLRFGPLVRVIAAEEIQVVRLGLVGWLLFEPLLLLRGHGRGQRSRNLLRQLALNLENVEQLAVVGLAPQLLRGPWIDQARNDPHPRPGPTDASFEDRRHAELLRDRGNPLARLLVLHSRRAADHLQRRYLGQRGDDVVSDPVAEVLILRVVAHVLERQHGDRPRTRPPSAGPGSCPPDCPAAAARSTTGRGPPR